MSTSRGHLQHCHLHPQHQTSLEVVVDQTQRFSSYAITVHLTQYPHQEVITKKNETSIKENGINLFRADFFNSFNMYCKTAIDDINRSHASSSSSSSPSSGETTKHQPQTRPTASTITSTSPSSSTYLLQKHPNLATFTPSFTTIHRHQHEQWIYNPEPQHQF